MTVVIMVRIQFAACGTGSRNPLPPVAVLLRSGDSDPAPVAGDKDLTACNNGSFPGGPADAMSYLGKLSLGFYLDDLL